MIKTSDLEANYPERRRKKINEETLLAKII